MNTFKQFLFESAQNEYDSIDKIKQAAPAYFAKFGDELLIRGLSAGDLKNAKIVGQFQITGNEEQQFVVRKIKVRKDRNPLTTPAEFHKKIDLWFKEKFDIFSRSETIFAVRLDDMESFGIAQGYGTASIIVPIGHTDYIWAQNNAYKDMYEALISWRRNLLVSPSYDPMIGITDELIHNFLDNGNYVMNDDAATLWPGSEIMVKCDEYFAITAEKIVQADSKPTDTVLSQNQKFTSYKKLCSLLS